MDDIARCLGDTCPLKNECYRFTIQEEDLKNPSVNYVFIMPPYNEKTKKCDYMIKDKIVPKDER